MAVGALESQFYAQLLAGLGMTEEELPQHEVETGRAKLTEKFKEKTQAEWCEVSLNEAEISEATARRVALC